MTTYPYPVTDSQVHIWAADSPERPWPSGWSKPHRPTPLTAESLLQEMDGAGVDRAVIVPPGWEGDRNDVALAAAKAHPRRLAVMGRIALDRPSGLSTWRSDPGMLGVRVTFSRGKHLDWLTDTTADWFWTAAEADGIPVMAYAPTMVEQLGVVAARHPELKLIVDHLGLHTEAYQPPELAEAVERALRLAVHPNIAVKVSGFPSAAATRYPYPDVHPYLRRVLAEFGRERVMWGSDMTRAPCTYRELVTMFTTQMPFLSELDQEWIMGQTLSQWLGWPAP